MDSLPEVDRLGVKHLLGDHGKRYRVPARPHCLPVGNRGDSEWAGRQDDIVRRACDGRLDLGMIN